MSRIKDTHTILCQSPSLFLTALRAYERSRTETSPPRDSALVSIVFSAASLEAFINEVAAFAELTSTMANVSTPKMNTLADLQSELEESRSSVNSKFIMSNWFISVAQLDKRPT